MEQFLNHPGPAVLEAAVDPLTAPLPGSVKAEQALHFVESLVRGETDGAKILKTVVADRVKELV